eukprot:3082582-Pyramimonas_sp.AAC.1
MPPKTAPRRPKRRPRLPPRSSQNVKGRPKTLPSSPRQTSHGFPGSQEASKRLQENSEKAPGERPKTPNSLIRI